jgi:hypothetical protein
MALNKKPEWRLKNIVAQITKKLFEKFLADYSFRCGNSKSRTG